MKKEKQAFSIKHIKTGYPGTGFSFHLVRCDSREALHHAVSTIPGVQKNQPWFADPEHGDVPDGFTCAVEENVIPGILRESAGSFNCEVYLVVNSASECERRVWHHEIGHAVDFVTRLYAKALKAKGLEVTPERRTEIPAYTNEYLCEETDNMLSGAPCGAVSGFAEMFK